MTDMAVPTVSLLARVFAICFCVFMIAVEWGVAVLTLRLPARELLWLAAKRT